MLSHALNDAKIHAYRVLRNYMAKCTAGMLLNITAYNNPNSPSVSITIYVQICQPINTIEGNVQSENH